MIKPAELWSRIKSRTSIVPISADISTAHIFPTRADPSPILPNTHYFSIVVDELFLAKSREWWMEYDPLVLTLTEFTYGNKHVVLPFVIGPKLLEGRVAQLPQGMIYRNTRIAGVHPFRGGRVVITMVLCKVRRKDYARGLVSFIESVASAVPFAAELSTYTRFAEPLLNGMDTLFGLGETAALVGLRREFDHDCGDPIRPAYFALIDGAETDYPSDQLWVRDGRLFFGPNADELIEFRSTNYVLFSIRSSNSLTDLAVLPFHAVAENAVALAASEDERDWKRAKAELVVLLRQLLSSPDLTQNQAMTYHESVVQRAKLARERATSLKNLSIGNLEKSMQGVETGPPGVSIEGINARLVSVEDIGNARSVLKDFVVENIIISHVVSQDDLRSAAELLDLP